MAILILRLVLWYHSVFWLRANEKADADMPCVKICQCLDDQPRLELFFFYRFSNIAEAIQIRF